MRVCTRPESFMRSDMKFICRINPWSRLTSLGSGAEQRQSVDSMHVGDSLVHESMFVKDGTVIRVWSSVYILVRQGPAAFYSSLGHSLKYLFLGQRSARRRAATSNWVVGSQLMCQCALLLPLGYVAAVNERNTTCLRPRTYLFSVSFRVYVGYVKGMTQRSGDDDEGAKKSLQFCWKVSCWHEI